MRRAHGSRTALGLIALAAYLTSSCVSTDYQARDWSTYDGPGAAYFQAQEVVFPHEPDPLEPLNRASAVANYAVLRWVVRPLAGVYRFVLPGPVRRHAEKAGDNLLFPVRFVNNLLQGKLKGTGIETARFLVNSTVGLLGLFDPAQTWGLHPHPEDFGQTFATWGWTDSTYLSEPIIGPQTVRDTVGLVPDTLADPATYFFPATLIRGFNRVSNSIEANLRVIDSAYDAYEPARTLFTLQREVQVTDFVWDEGESGPAQTLQAIFLEPEDTSFAGRARTEQVQLGSGKQLPYNLWLQSKPAPLMYVLPGLGGHRYSGAALALAEVGYEQGHSVVIVSNPTNFEFMRTAATVTVPGYGPADASDLHVALTAIDRELEAGHPGRFLGRRLVGISMGAYQALRIASGNGEPRDEDLLEFDLFLAINPPVDLQYALLQLDRFYNSPLTFPAQERDERMAEIFGKVLYLSQGDLEPGMELPFTELESQFLIGLAFRLDLQFMILQSQDLEDLGVLQTKRTRWHKAPAFREAAEFSYMEYFYAFALPYHARRLEGIECDEDGARQLFERCDLHSLTEGLQARTNVHVFTNENDFLLRAQDIDWLREVLGDRLTLFEQGGHLGNLYRKYLKQLIGETLNEVERPHL